jgi:hypothetical protein
MKYKPVIAALSLVLTAAVTSTIFAAEPVAADADQALKAMSAKLASAKQLSFQVDREIDPALLEDRNVPEKARIDIRVSRPNGITARSVSRNGARRIIADGRTVTVYDEKKNHYAQVPMRGTIDGLVDQLEEKYGFVPPVADFVVSDPYAGIRQQASAITSLGRQKVSGVECDHFLLKGKEADAELWIAVTDQLPRKFVATFRRAGKPQLRIAFSNWNLTAPIAASNFSFSPPVGAQKIEMWTKARMQALAAKH